MARPTKKGLDYFPLDTSIDYKLKLILAEFGLVGYGVVIRLFQEIYGQEGYYIKWRQDVALLFASENGVGCNVVSEVVNSCLKRSIFNQELFDKFEVLSSVGIQKRYVEATSRRAENNMIKEYVLLNAHIKPVIDNNNQDNDNNNSKNDDNNSQSKVKESKSKENKELNTSVILLNNQEYSVEEAFEYIWKYYPRGEKKKAAKDKFIKLTKEDTSLPQKIFNDIEKRNYDEWKIDKKFIPHMTTYLNNERWNDDPVKKRDRYSSKYIESIE